MMEVLFFASLTMIFFLLFQWAFRVLPREKWQIMAAVPTDKQEGGLWSGTNLTWYGFFSACAYVLAAAVYIILASAAGVSPAGAILTLGSVLLVCAPSARILARLIEGKRYTFTVGGASFVGILIAPFVTRFTETVTGWALPVLPVISAMAVAYAFGEGLGRLACVSFGCCYGRPLTDFGPAVQRLFGRWAFIFTGKTKKISYESGLDGQKVFPVQALSAAINIAAGLAGAVLFHLSQFESAFLLVVLVTQSWRFFSEFLRADFRGRGRLTAYQKMNIAAIPYAAAIAILVPDAAQRAVHLESGLAAVWNPSMILLLQGLWILSFLYTGRSRVTGSTVEIFVHRDRI